MSNRWDSSTNSLLSTKGPASSDLCFCLEKSGGGSHVYKGGVKSYYNFTSKGRLYALCLLVFLTSFCVAARVMYIGYLSQNPVCMEMYRGAEGNADVRDAFVRERLRFPRTKRHLPQCIIIGVRKCGTRALLEFLNIHPSVQKASDEIHFFDENSKYRLGLEWYRRKMPYSFQDQVTVEKSPAYFITESVPERIKAMNQSIKLLLIVRDPVTRLISDYAQLAANKAKKERRLASFEELVLLPDGTINTSYKAVRISMYVIFFQSWLRVFPRSQIFIVNGDRLITDPFPVVQQVEDFLGLSHRITRENFFYNHTKGFYCVRNDTVEKCLNESKGRKHPQVSHEVVQRLRKFYAPYNREFYQLAGHNFDWPEE